MLTVIWSTVYGAVPACVNAGLAILILWGSTRILDRLGGGRWSHFRDTARTKIHEEPMACAVYYGARLLAFALVVGPIFAAVRG